MLQFGVKVCAIPFSFVDVSSTMIINANKAAVAVLGAVLSSSVALAAGEQDVSKAADASILRVCAAANEAPYSVKDGSGFENRIAEVLASAMGRKVQFVWSPKAAIYAVKEQLDPGKCDVIMGTDAGDPRVLTSKPYYRASYVFIQRKDSKLDITSYDSPDLEKTKHIAYEPGSPSQTMVEKLGLFNRNFNFIQSLTDFKSRRNQYIRLQPTRIVGAVDVGIAFAPEVARYVKQNGSDLKMTVIPDNNTRSDGKKVPLAFDQSVAVRKGDEKLMKEINAALEKAAPKIQDILKGEGIPLLAAGSDTPKEIPSKS
jgi:mxaJ protein